MPVDWISMSAAANSGLPISNGVRGFSMCRVQLGLHVMCGLSGQYTALMLEE